MELAVIADAPVDPCAPTIPCLDLRGWMFDDNNGLHGANGVASGCARFSTNALWACVPTGTIILIYNGADPNPSLPANDVSTADGNCSIVVDANDPAYFEYTSVTPAADCTDPGGWGADGSPTWLNNCALANPGDCARLTNATGCEVFTLCYGNANGGSTVYFAGNGQRRVYYFNDGDPTVQSNWAYGCAGAAQCGGDEQTPGAPNNALNAAYLAQFNPNCASSTAPDPILVSATTTEACGCANSATASATGSVPGYTFVWYDAAWAPIGQNTATATGLCVGTFHVIGTSSVGCSDTATVTFNGVGGPTLALSSPHAASCGSPTGEACVEITSPNGPFTILWSDPLAQTTACASSLPPGDQTVTVTDNAGCTSTGTVTVADSVPNVSVSIVTAAAACGSATGHACATVINGGAATWAFTWSDPAAQTTACATGLSPGSYTVTITDANGCTASSSGTVNDSIPDVSVSFTSTAASCGAATGEACATVVNGGSASWAFAWNDAAAQTTACATALLPGDYTVIATDANGCTATGTVTVDNDVPSISVSAVVQVTCAGANDGAITLSLPDDSHTLSWTGPGSFTASTPAITGLAPGTYTYTWAANTPCVLSGSVDITEPLPLVMDVSTTGATCQGVCDGTLTLTITNGYPGFTLLVDGTPTALVDPIPACPGDHAIALTDAHGCTASTTVTVADGPPGPNAGISPLDPLCIDAPAVLIDAVDGGGAWSGAGIADPAVGLFDPALAGAGDHWVYHRIAGACSDADSIQVHVEAQPIAGFTTSPNVPSELDAAVQLINASIGGESFAWTVDGHALATSPNASMPVVPGQLDYTICLIASGLPACADTVCRVLTLTSPVRVYIPNSFTPDGDGINDAFGPVFSGTPPVECSFRIFDRWGQEIFGANDLGNAIWTGEVSGSPAKTDVYIWRLTYRGAITGEQEALVGHVTLLR